MAAKLGGKRPQRSANGSIATGAVLGPSGRPKESAAQSRASDSSWAAGRPGTVGDAAGGRLKLGV